jgi:hypothetical protein
MALSIFFDNPQQSFTRSGASNSHARYAKIPPMTDHPPDAYATAHCNNNLVCYAGSKRRHPAAQMDEPR